MQPSTKLNLSGPWKFRIAGEGAAGGRKFLPSHSKGLPPQSVPKKLDKWMPATVPGTVHHQLFQQGKIADPHYGQNELSQQWIDEHDWDWGRTFTATAAQCKSARQELIFDGVDTIATILLNGNEVGHSVNMFRQIVCDVRGVLKPGKNEILVRLKSPTRYASQQFEVNQKRVPMFDWTWVPGEVRLTGRAYIRKVQCHFGWDWGLYLATCGIWQGVRLECADGPRLVSVVVKQEHVGPIGAPSSVKLNITAHLAGPDAGEGELLVTIGGASVAVVKKIAAGESKVAASIAIEAPQLWWSNGQGDQHLYDLHLQWKPAGSDQVCSTLHRRVGLRTLELVRDKDTSPDGKPAESFYFKINGRPVFMKGANWIPADQFIERCTPAVYRHQLHSMVEANMNMIRVWGGGWYEQDSFYDLCDELGILVWQDFMMACALYPDTPEFLSELAAEAKYQVRRLHARPCIAIWCGDNEDMGAVFEWWRQSPDFDKNVKIYTKVMKSLQKTVEAEDTTRAFWISSPCNGEIGEWPDNPNLGDVHYWKVWHKKEPFSNYWTVKPRFASEFGFQSFPEPRTIRAVTPAEEMNPSSRVMEHHQRSPDGNMLITNTIARELPIPKDFDTYCWASQINQAMAIRTAVEHWRRLRPWCMGTIYWQLNDLWPVVSWSSIDYHGRWKVLHHFAARFYSPLLVSTVHEGSTLTVWATSDVPQQLGLAGEIEVFTFGGKRVLSKPLNAELAALGSSAIATFNTDDLLAGYSPRDICVFVRLSGGGHTHENFATLVPWKWVILPEPVVTTRLEGGKDGLRLTAQTSQVVPFFHAELGDAEGHFAGDWQTLRPGRKYTLPWVPHTDLGATPPSLVDARRSLIAFSLYDTFTHESAASPENKSRKRVVAR